MKKQEFTGTIKRRILTTTLLFTLVIGIAIASFSYVYYSRNYRINQIESTEINLKFINDALEKNLGYIFQFSQWCCTNTMMAEYVENAAQNNTYHSIEAFDRLNEEVQNNPMHNYLHRVVVADKEDHFLQIVPSIYSRPGNLALEVPKLPYFEKAINTPEDRIGLGFEQDPFYSRFTQQVIPLIRPITSQFSSAQHGWVMIQISADLFSSVLRTYMIEADSRLILEINEHSYRLEGDEFIEVEPLEIKESGLEVEFNNPGSCAGTFVNDDGETVYIVSVPSAIPGIRISQSLSHLEQGRQQQMFRYLLLMIILLVIVLSSFLLILLNQMINRPMKGILNKIDAVSKGDFSRDPGIEWNHEFGQIGRGINDLGENVDELMDNRLAVEKEKRDLEYQVVLSQIQPHFLYNTLNSIKWMATAQNAKGIAEMTTSLARLLKSVSKGTSISIPLREELALVNDYFTIQQYRYGGTISLVTKVEDEDLLDCMITKFTLQPLVENSIFHGIEPKGTTGTVIIHVSHCDNSDVQIEVADDGVGMSEELAASLLSQTQQKADKGLFSEIGIANVNKRLQYEYGPQYGISIRSVQGSYTTMMIRIPYHAEG